MARKGVGADVRGWAWVRAFDKDDTGYTHSWDAWRLPDRTLEEEGGWEESVGQASGDSKESADRMVIRVAHRWVGYFRLNEGRVFLATALTKALTG